MKLTFPVVFSPCVCGVGYVVTVPDLPGCVTQGDSLSDAILMGQDAASGWILVALEEGGAPPKASTQDSISLEPGEFTSYHILDIDGYAKKYGINCPQGHHNPCPEECFH